MILSVRGANYQIQQGMNEYTLTDNSTVTETPSLPVSSRWKYWDARQRRILDKTTQKAMKDAVNRHKKKWGYK
ncbi:hypothetical protein ACUUMB_15040 [Enterobacter kobei]